MNQSSQAQNQAELVLRDGEGSVRADFIDAVTAAIESADAPRVLDMLGDLYLSGIPARFLNVVGTRNGHTANVKMAAMMFEATNAKKAGC